MIRSSWRRRFERLTDLVRVETLGKVSLGRVVAVARYTEQTSALRRAAVVLLSPLPSLIVTLMIALIPLAPPDWKHRCHWGYLVRLLSTSFVCTFSCLHQLTHYLQSLPESRQYLIPRTLLIAIGNVACIVPIIYWIAFPIPFSAVTTSPSWVACILGDMALVWGKAVRNRFRELKEPIIKTIKMMMCQFNLIGIYPVYYFVYGLLGASERVILMFLLPIIKIALRIWFSNSITHLRDELPEVVVTNVDVFNALFMMYCMQITPSLMTTLGLIFLDFAQSTFSLYDIRAIQLKVNESYDQIAKGSVVLPRSSSYVTRAAAIISPTCKPATGKEVVRGKQSVRIAMTAGSKVQVHPQHLLRGK